MLCSCYIATHKLKYGIEMIYNHGHGQFEIYTFIFSFSISILVVKVIMCRRNRTIVYTIVGILLEMSNLPPRHIYPCFYYTVPTYSVNINKDQEINQHSYLLHLLDKLSKES